MIASLNRRLEAQQLSCVLTDAARNFIVENGYDPVYGARPLRRYIQRTLETLISRRIVAGSVVPGAVLKVDTGSEGLSVTAEQASS